jgi:protein ImuA
LRLLLQGSQEMEVHIVKRRGPPLDEPLHLPAVPARLQALLASRRRTPVEVPATPEPRRSHVLDRLVSLP